MIFKLIRVVGFYFISYTLDSMGYGICTKQWWGIILAAFVMCLACGVEYMYE